MPASVPFAVSVFVAAFMLPQGPSANGQSKTAFDVVSVRPVPPGRTGRLESYCANGGRFVSRGTPLVWSIEWAYGLSDYQLGAGWPEWLNSSETYDIDAETDSPVSEADCKKMVQTLFEERFKLQMHPQSKTVSACEPVAAKNSPNFTGTRGVTINGVLKQSTSEREAPPAWTMARLANYLSSVSGVQRPAFDRTMMSGAYGFKPSYSTKDGDDRPDIFSALRDQLGLSLKTTKAPMQMWVVDHVEKPGAN
jgi:uncharacterized protein (TIGR03435 family)